ncbi:hypothetical protein FAM09_09485 [Niastella caeni]|uniref:Uncharacterized protein n=1 Tax=Niastella caeni TaxID=2569763 RepID=A0A4S8HWS6_9BACT|nr:hypothetical protein [Niastella caeni]THU40107.1 hypothetical protein FAM09_09485 [Niastella caeni]
MKKKTFKLATTNNSTSSFSLENTRTTETLLLENALPVPPSEETVARLNAIAREYPFCAYIKQNNLYLL